MECCLWYASPQRLFPILPATKTRTFRQQLRHARTAGHCAADLSSPKRISPVSCHAWCTKPSTPIVRLCEHKSLLRNSHHVAGGSRQFLLRWPKAEVGPREYLNAGSANVQTGPLKPRRRATIGTAGRTTASGPLHGTHAVRLAQRLKIMSAWMNAMGA